MFTLKINNLPAYASDPRYPFIVYRLCEGEAWFYGAYETEERAASVAAEVNGGIAEQF